MAPEASESCWRCELDAARERRTARESVRALLLPLAIVLTLVPRLAQNWAFGQFGDGIAFLVEWPLMLGREMLVVAAGCVGLIWVLAESLLRPRGLRDPLGVVARVWLVILGAEVVRWSLSASDSVGLGLLWPVALAACALILCALWTLLPSRAAGPRRPAAEKRER
jgi:hypothetical protein